MGDFFSPSYNEVKQPFETNPWSEQTPFIKKGLQRADKAYNTASNKDPVADLNATQTQALNKMGYFGIEGAGDAYARTSGAGRGLLESVDGYGDNAQSLYDRATSPDRFKSAAETAAETAENPYLQTKFDGALDQIYEKFGMERAGINSNASGTGNINSTRAGVLEAMAQEDAVDAATQTAADMYGRSYETNLDRALRTEADSISQGGSLNEQLARAGQMGVDFIGRGLDYGSMGAQQAYEAGAIRQGQQQKNADAARYGNFDIAQRYMDLVGSNVYGKEGFTTKVDKEASPFQQILGGIATVAGAIPG